jgi:dipeptidyl aminopeptidase/acylaminoacyl peptidase
LSQKKLINLSQIPYWKNISKNDTLIDNYSYLDSLNFYFIKYRSDSLIINGFTIEPKYGVNFPIVILNRGGNREFGAWTVGSLIEWGSPIARAGYIIIASQYRGNSGSMGKDEFGGKDVNDVLNLIPIVKEIPQSDTSRIGMYGWSRGGLMTYIALTKTTKIKTAIIGGTPTDLIACNSTYNKLAVKCSAETFLVYGSLVLRNYIRGDSRQLLVAANRYSQVLGKLRSDSLMNRFLPIIVVK